MSLKSDNGHTCLSADSNLLRDWIAGPVTFRGRSGPVGFILTHLAQWIHEEIEPLDLAGQPADDHMHGVRFIGGGTSGVPSNHWSATAVDVNARKHVQGTSPFATWTPTQVKRIRTKIDGKYKGLVWGGDWNAVDSMHFEFMDIKDFPKEKITALALSLVPTPIGKRVIAAQTKPVKWETWAA